MIQRFTHLNILTRLGPNRTKMISVGFGTSCAIDGLRNYLAKNTIKILLLMLVRNLILVLKIIYFHDCAKAVFRSNMSVFTEIREITLKLHSNYSNQNKLQLLQCCSK